MSDETRLDRVLGLEDLLPNTDAAPLAAKRASRRTLDLTNYVTLGFLQFAPQHRSEIQNAQYIFDVLSRAKVASAIIVLPEFFLSSYEHSPLFFRRIRELEKLLAPLCRLARRKRLTLVGSLPIQSDRGVFNSAVRVSGAGLQHLYDKVKLFETELARFAPGDDAYNIGEVDGLKYSVQICLDIVDPVPVQAAARNGARFILAPASVSIDFLRTIHKSRSLETQSVSIFCNRSGAEADNGTRYLGRSAFFFPDGSEWSADAQFEGLELISVTRSHLDAMGAVRRRLTL